jgi:MFS family permease
VPDLAVTFGLLLIYNLISGGITTASQAAYVSVAPANLRATVAAVLNSLATVLGSIGGPLFFGLVNDQLKQVYGDQSLRYTLLLVPLMMIIAALLHYFASFSMDRDVKTALRD